MRRSSNSWDFQDPRTQSMNEIYTCKRYLMGDPDIQESEINNIFMTQSENVCVIDYGCPKSVMSQMWANTYKAEIIKVRYTFFTDCEDDELKRKLHVMTAHKQEETLLRFLKGSKSFNPKVNKILSEVTRESVTCKTMKRTPDRPKVALPKAFQSN